MMAAFTAAQSREEVVLCEKNNKLGRKLYITGKGRCNLTNDITPEEFLKNVISNPKFLYSAINRYTPQETMLFFENHGCTLKTERGGRVFPLSDHSSDVIRTFEKALANSKVNIKYDCKVKDLKQAKDGFLIECDNNYEFFSDCVIIACGGMSYPVTGSTGDGYSLAQKLGHTIIKPRPALVPIMVKEDVSSLQGLSLKNVSLTAKNGNKTISSLFGEMLFTDNGYLKNDDGEEVWGDRIRFKLKDKDFTVEDNVRITFEVDDDEEPEKDDPNGQSGENVEIEITDKPKEPK